LFSSREISFVDDLLNLNSPTITTTRTREVDLDETVVINTERDGYDSIGTTGLASCIGIAARGKNKEGETLLGLSHYSGLISTPAEALTELQQMMTEAGALSTEMYVVGGMRSSDPDLDTYDRERQLLALRNSFNIRGARLHVNESTDINNAEHVNMLVSRDHVHFSRDEIYDSND
jgi:hypothetical protein